MSLKLTPYLIMDGQAKEAVEFYKQVLDAEVIAIATFGDMPGPLDDNLKDRIAHANIRVGDTELMISDSAGSSMHAGNQVTICITSTNSQKLETIFRSLRQNGEVNVTFQKTSFSPGFGNVTDKFGVTFQIMTQK